MPPRKLVAGNWKMNGLRASASVLDELATRLPAPDCDVLVCPPATLISALSGGGFATGAQDCHWQDSGAHTGDISAQMLADAGASAVIVGHSERRADHGEIDGIVAAKAAAAWRAGLVAIVCLGETGAERAAGETLLRVGDQAAGSIPDGATAENLVVAYEPVWAIGTGLVPSMSEIAEVHEFLRASLSDRLGLEIASGIRLLYGGSVNAGNAHEIFAVANVDGALVGGASLKAESFATIIAAAGAS